MAIDISYLRTKLEDERARLEAELKTIAVKKSDGSGAWESVPDPDETQPEFQDEYADASEELNERQATDEALSAQLKQVITALANIDAGTYGRCIVCGSPIEDARLNADPSAQTCIAHKDHN
jgi:RNA polymerase-binding transcription factor DksA